MRHRQQKAFDWRLVPEVLRVTQSQATRSIIDTHRHIFGPKLRQKFVENIGLDDSKPLPQANAGEMFFYRESVDVDYSMELQRKSGVTLCINSYGGEVDMFAKKIIKASTIDTLKFLHEESFDLQGRFPEEVASMANAHALGGHTGCYRPADLEQTSLRHQHCDQLRIRCRSGFSRLAQGRVAMGVRAGQICSRPRSSSAGSDRGCFNAAV
jgi:hypothetical protein